MKRLITLELPLPLTGAQEAIIGELVQDAVHKLQSTGLHDLRILFQTRESLEAVKSTYDAGKHYVMMLGETLAKKVIKYFGGRPGIDDARDLYDRAEQLLGGEKAVADDKTLAACKTRFNNRENFCGAPDSIPAFDYQISGQITHSMRSNAEHVRASLKYAIIADAPNVAQVNNRDALLRLLDEIEATGEVDHSYDETMIVELGKTAYNYLRDRLEQVAKDRFASICYGLYEALTTARDGLTKHRAKPEAKIVTKADEWLKSEEARQIILGGDGRAINIRYTALIALLSKYAEVAEGNSHSASLDRQCDLIAAIGELCAEARRVGKELINHGSTSYTIDGNALCDATEKAEKVASQSSAVRLKKNDGILEGQLAAIRLTDQARRVLSKAIVDVRASRDADKITSTSILVDERALEELLDLIERYVS